MHVLTHWELPEVSHPGLTDHLVFSLHVWGCLSHRMFRCPRIKENGKLKVLVSHCVVSIYRRLMLLNNLEKKSAWKRLNTRAFSLRRQAFFQKYAKETKLRPQLLLTPGALVCLLACFITLSVSRSPHLENGKVSVTQRYRKRSVWWQRQGPELVYAC